MLQSVSGVIRSISEEVKTKSNGKNYLVCVVDFPNGKSYFAQRTLGENKAPITVGQTVTCMPTIVEGDDGIKKPFFEISTGTQVSDADDILAMLGA